MFISTKIDYSQMQFMIVDDEVILRGFDNDVGDIRCSIQHPEFSRMFRAYYARLWRAAIVLKDETGVNEEELQKWTNELQEKANVSETRAKSQAPERLRPRQFP